MVKPRNYNSHKTFSFASHICISSKITMTFVTYTSQSPSQVPLSETPWTAAHQAPLSFTISQNLLKFLSTEPGMPSNHFILSPSSPPALNLFQHQGIFQ